MLERVAALGWREIVLAAAIAYVLFYIIRQMQRVFGRKKELNIRVRNADIADVYEKCKELFPIQILNFQGKEFRRGMQVQVVTIQNKIIIGELIGISKTNLVCIRAGNQIVAHQLEKIAQVIGLD